MPIELPEAEACLYAGAFERLSTTSKVMQFKSLRNGRVLYLRLGQGFPSHADIVVHPDLDIESLIEIDGVQINGITELRHSNAMKSFPMRKHRGTGLIHYGRALQVRSPGELQAFCDAFHCL